MIPIIKKWQEDELLYSWLHRLADANGLSMPVFAEAYLGTNSKNASIGSLSLDVRNEFVAFAKNNPTTKTLDELYWDSSIYGFESMWMTKSQQARYTNNVFRKKDKLNAPVNTLIKKIRICKECYEEDLENGVPYIRCKHQLSGVLTCHRHKNLLLEYVGTKGHECDFNMQDYVTVDTDISLESLIAYTEYAIGIFNEYMSSDAKSVKRALFEKLKECGYESTEHYSKLIDDLNHWKYKDLLPKDIETFLRVKMISANYINATEVIPFFMFLCPDINEFRKRVETTDYILALRTCPICGLEYGVTPYAESIGFGCPDCDAKIPLQERFRNLVNKIDADYVFQDEFVSLDEKMTVYHKACERFITMKPRAFLYDGTRCKCESVTNFRNAEKAVAEHKGFRLIEFNGSNNPVTIYNESCGHTFSCNYFKFLNFPGCRVCKPKHMTAEIFAERIYKLVGDEYRIIEGFVDQRTKIVLEHQICGSRQAFTPSVFLDGQRCRFCTKLEASWNKQYEILCEYQKEFGHVNVPKRDEYGGITLGLWCQRMRRECRNGKLSKYQIKKMEAIGFDWDPLETEWMRRYKQYKRYIEETGGPEISRRTDFEGEHLGAWVETQRKWYAKGKMSEKRVMLLKRIGVDFIF